VSQLIHLQLTTTQVFNLPGDTTPTTTTITTNLQPDTEAQVAGQLARQLAAIAANPPLPWIKQETTS